MTLAERLDETRGRPAGFDYLRILLALTIVGWHTVVTSYGLEAQRLLSLGPSRPLWALLVPMFFALSGFLVAGSLERTKTLVGFLGLRLIRLVPALAVESTLAVVVLGPFFTTLDLAAYLRDPQTASYLLNIVGEIHFYLPGVFETNPVTQVNGQLWTLPAELKCYVLISAVTLLGLYRPRFGMVAVCVLVQVYAVYRLPSGINAEAVGIPSPGTLVACFVFGAAFYRYRTLVPWRAGLFVQAGVTAVALLCFDRVNALAGLPVAYATVYLGLTDPPRLRVFASGDYSYGIFLYGFPIQQAVSALLPGQRHWWVNLAVGGPLTCAIAWLSWHGVEKRALRLRQPLSRVEALWLRGRVALSAAYHRVRAFDLRARWARD